MEDTVISPLAVANTLLRRRSAFVRGAAVGLLLAIAVGLLRGAYRTTGAFSLSTSSAQTSSLVGLAAQFGVGTGVPFLNTESVDFYASVAMSPDVLAKVAQTTLTLTKPSWLGFRRDTVTGTIADFAEITETEAATRARKAIKYLEHHVSVDADQTAGIVSVGVTTKWPELSVAIARRLLELVNEFDVSQRQTQAAAERAFVELRLNDSRHDLDAAEDSLTVFLEKNRSYQSSPELVAQAGRLQRRIDVKQSVYTGLARSYEQARIDEVRNTPVITVVTSPETMVERVPSLLVLVVVAIGMATIIGLFCALLLEYAARTRVEQAAAFSDFQSLTGETKTQVRRVLRRLTSGPNVKQ